jgi:hypothetical protein
MSGMRVESVVIVEDDEDDNKELRGEVFGESVYITARLANDHQMAVQVEMDFETFREWAAHVGRLIDKAEGGTP